MTKQRNTSIRSAAASIGFTFAGLVLVCVPLALWVAWSVEIMGYVLLAGLVAMVSVLALTPDPGRAPPMLPGALDEPTDAATPLPDRGHGDAPENGGRTPLVGWQGAGGLDYMGVLEQLRNSGGVCDVCGKPVEPEDLGAMYRRRDQPTFVCRRAGCRSAAYHRESSGQGTLIA